MECVQKLVDLLSGCEFFFATVQVFSRSIPQEKPREKLLKKRDKKVWIQDKILHLLFLCSLILIALSSYVPGIYNCVVK